jgi:DNA-binding CsgD family transcriptional regulator
MRLREIRGRPGAPLHDRLHEVAAIGELLDGAHGGAGGALAIVGPAGIGRTALLEHACKRAGERGFAILVARGVEHERELPFGVAHQALARQLGRRVRALLLAASTQRAALLGLHAALTALAEHTPTLLAIDDAQWADEASMHWLAFTALRLAGTRVALVVGARTGEVRGLTALEESGATMLRPRPLGAPAIAALLRARLGREPAPGLVLACRAATGGNPFLLGEHLATLESSCRGSASSRLERFVEGRMAALAPGARRLGEAVALLGQAVELRDAAALAGLEGERAAAAADELRQSDLLASGDVLSFAESLVAETVYTALPPSRRALMHARAARLSTRRAAAARHLLASLPGADPWAAGVLRREGERALADGATSNAVALLRRAAREAVVEGRGELMTALGIAEARLGCPEALRHLRVARRLCGADRIAPELVRSLLAQGRGAEAFAFADEVARNAPELRSRLEVELYDGTRLVPGLGARTAARVACHERTLPACAAAELACRGISSVRAAALARSVSTAPGSTEHTISCQALIWCDDLAHARDLSEAARSAARRHGAIAVGERIAAQRAELELRAGSLAAAEAHARSGGARALAWLILVLLERGEHESAAELLASAPVDAGAALRFARGRLRISQRDFEGGLADLLEAGAVLQREHVPGPAVLPWRAEAALAHAARGDAAEAERHAREEYRLAREFGAPRPLGLALRALAAAGGCAARVERCREAVAVLARSEARLDHAHALCDLGAALRRGGARREAREPLRAALDTATRLDAAALAARAREELVVTGARPRRAAQSGRDALTPAEVRVAGLAMRGLANREIAQELFLTVKTIETELGHAYAKLGIRSRRELASALGS